VRKFRPVPLFLTKEEAKENVDMIKPTADNDRSRRPWGLASLLRLSRRTNGPEHKWLAMTVVILLSTVLALFAVQTVFAQERIIKADGILTEVSKDSVTIDKGGYTISWSTKVYDMDGKRITIENLQLPVKVKFEYVNTDKGPVVRSMRAVGV
jgi:hypothetical protein